MNFLTSPELILALAKITALLLVIPALAPLLKNPVHRARLWTLTFLVLPLLFLSSFTTPILRLIPKDSPPPQQDSSSPAPLSLEPLLITTPLPEANEQLITIPTTPAVPLSETSVLPATEVAQPSTPETIAVTETTPTNYLPWIPIILCLGIILSLLPFLISSLKIHFLKRSEAQDPPSSLWRKIHQSDKQTPLLSFTPSPAAPFTCGIIRPQVLLPDDSPLWPLRRLHSTLLHEAAHLRRRDPLVRLFATVVRAAFWFHPLLWLSHRKLVAAQEHACDQYALTHGISPDDYAEDLLASATHSHLTPSEALSMAKWSQLGNRIRHILEKPKQTSMTTLTLTLTTLLALVATLGFTSIGFSQSEPPAQTEKTFTKEGKTPELARTTAPASQVIEPILSKKISLTYRPYQSHIHRLQETHQELLQLIAQEKKSENPNQKKIRIWQSLADNDVLRVLKKSIESRKEYRLEELPVLKIPDTIFTNIKRNDLVEKLNELIAPALPEDSTFKLVPHQQHNPVIPNLEFTGDDLDSALEKLCDQSLSLPYFDGTRLHIFHKDPKLFEKIKNTPPSKESEPPKASPSETITEPKLTAKVTHRTPATLTINRGRQHGIKLQQTVLSPEGLVGRIISSTDQSSKVLLLTGEESQVSAKVENTASVGIVSGQPNHPEKMPKLRLRYLSKNANLKPGALVYTDGRAQLFPTDLLLGSVESFTPGPVYGEAIVKPAVNFPKLETLCIDLPETSPADEGAKKQPTRGALLDRKNKPLATNGADGLRSYPAGKPTAHLIGYVGKVRAGEPEIIEGRSGLERTYDLPLSQQKNVKLTLDAALQEHCYKLLESQKHPGVIVVQDPNNGEILALASYPSFDPNLFIPFISRENFVRLRDDKQKPLFHRAAQGRFVPGSIVKPLVALAGEYAGLNNPEINCKGLMTFGKEGKLKISDWKRNRDELLRIPGALKTSCHTYFMELAIRTGDKALTDTGKLFHLNDHLLPELPAARSTWMTWPEGTKPTRVHLALTSIGQGHLVLSPLEINAVTSALAIGTWHQPHLLPGQKPSKPAVNLIGKGKITAQSLEHIRRGLLLAVNEKGGTAGRAALATHKVAGKIGTARLGRRGDGLTYNSWFTGYAPFEKPKYAITVLLEGPNSGGKFAAPLASAIFKLLLEEN